MANKLQRVTNKQALFDYELLDRYEAGIILTGSEVKSAKLGQVSLKESYVKFMGNELWLVHANINPYKFADNTEYDPIRSRKLLLNRREILRLHKKMEGTNLTIVPTALYTKGRRVKLEIALARGKKEFEKREKKKRQDLDREKQRELGRY